MGQWHFLIINRPDGFVAGETKKGEGSHLFHFAPPPLSEVISIPGRLCPPGYKMGIH